MEDTEIPCQFPGCDHKVTHASEAVALVMFKTHAMSHEPMTASTGRNSKLPPIPRPELGLDVSEEDYCSFVVKWNNFKRISGIGQDSHADQLFQCCDKDLMKLVIRSQPDIVSKGEVELLKEMKDLAVVKVATSARRAQLLASKQAPGETIREFYANVRAAAAICKFEVRCKQTCCASDDKEDMVDYTDMVIKDVLIAGIYDADIRKDILSTADLDKKDDKEVVRLVEAKEIAYKAWSSANSGTNNAFSSYKRNLKQDNETDHSIKTKLALKGKCSKCSKEISLYKRYRSGKMNKTPFSKCQRCHKNDSGNPSNNAVALSLSLFQIAVAPSPATGYCSGAASCAPHQNGLPHYRIVDYISMRPQTSATTRCYPVSSGVLMASASKRCASTILHSSGSTTRSAKVTRRPNFSFLASASSCWVQ